MSAEGGGLAWRWCPHCPCPHPTSPEWRQHDQWWDQIGGEHDPCPCFTAADTIALPSSCWGDACAWATSARLITPTGAQALAPEAGQEKVGAGRNIRLYSSFVQQISMSGLALGWLFVEGAVGWWGHGGCSLPWPCSHRAANFRHRLDQPSLPPLHHPAKWGCALTGSLGFPSLPWGWLPHKCRKPFPRQSNVVGFFLTKCNSRFFLLCGFLMTLSLYGLYVTVELYPCETGNWSVLFFLM